MKKITLFFLSACACFFAFPQKFSLNWGDENKVKGFYEMEIVHADKNGVYMLQGRMKSKFYIAVTSYKMVQKLNKFNAGYESDYDTDFKKELKGINFFDMQSLHDRLVLFGNDYEKRDRKHIIYGQEIDKSTGDGLGERKELCSISLDSKKDDVDFAITPLADESGWIVVADITDKENITIQANTFDEELKNTAAVSLSTGFAPQTFDLENVLFTKNKTVLVLGREYVFVEEKKGKKTSKKRVFKQYVVQTYNMSGQKTGAISIDLNGNYVAGGQAVQMKNGDIYLAGMYSKSPARDSVNGVFFYKIDAGSGTVSHSSVKELTKDMISTPGNNKAVDTANDEVSLSASLNVRNIIYNEKNNSLLLITENSKFSQSSYQSTSYDGGRWRYTTYTSFTYQNDDIVVINANLNTNQISKLYTIPKKQYENYTFRVTSADVVRYSPMESFGNRNSSGMPYFSSFSSLLAGDKLVFVLNDAPENKRVKKASDKVTEISDFKDSDAVAISLDLATAEITRKTLYSNYDEPVLMPRFGYVVNNEVYLVSSKRNGMLSKPRLRIGKLSVQ